ncbi:MAG TPA: hypothetical protein VMT30_05795 [Candidatus Saccharimonadia bacterium]|nr:hypothetical protein [Candidatus Saccharimonadia bacterium]
MPKSSPETPDPSGAEQSDPVIELLKEVLQEAGPARPQIGPAAEAMAAALTAEQLATIEERVRADAAAQNIPVTPSLFAELGEPYRAQASALKTAGDLEGATQVLAASMALNILGRNLGAAQRAERARAARDRLNRA